MNDTPPTIAQLTAEVAALRQRVAELEAGTALPRPVETPGPDPLVALRASEQRAQAMLRAIPDLMFRLDRQGVFLDYKAALDDLYAQAEPTLIGRRNRDIMPPEFADLIDREIQLTLATGVLQTFEYHLPIPGRGVRGYEARMAPSGPDEVTVIVRDVTERQQAEEALRLNEARFRAIIELSPIPYALNDEAQRITYLNSAFTRTFGYDLTDIPTLAEWWPRAYPDPAYRRWVADTWQARLDRAKATGTNFEPMELDIRCKDGSVKTVIISAGSLESSFIGTHLVILYDITERKQAEENLRQSEARFRAIVNSSPVPIGMNDAALKITLINPAFTRAYGYTVGDLPTVHDWWLNAYPDAEYREQIARIWFEHLAQARQTGFFEPIEADIHCKDGSVRTVRSTAATMNYGGETIIINYDITDRVRALQALATSEARARAMLSAIPDMVFRLDRQGVYLDYKASPADLYAQTTPLIGVRNHDIAPPEFAALIEEKTRVALETGALQTFEFDLPVPGQGLRDYEARLIASGQDEVTAIVRDITERKQAEERFLRAQKMESLGILAGGVAHDFNNLLVALLGQTSLAATLLQPDHPAQPHLERALTAARRAADLTRQMLAYSGRGGFEMAPFDFNGLIRDNANLLASSISKAIQVRLDLAEALPLIQADAGQMQQIIMNLVLNAAEAIGEQAGTISLATSVIDVVTEADSSARERWARYTGQAVLPGCYVQLRVADTGSGMSSETLERIFDPFFTTRFTGRGLGLAAVLGIVRGHRGGLWVDSAVGCGTTFTLIFPETEAPLPVAQPSYSVGAARHSVLIIDDEEPVRSAVDDILTLDDVPVICAATGEDGLALFRERQTEIGLVLLDLSMPGLSGRETFDRLLALDPAVRVVLSSGYTQAEAMRGFEGRPLAGFLHKPYDLETLRSSVRQHLPHSAAERDAA